jgi:NAD(P)-dependent dehydrogenase (short-subunit alcohol dehydrogenase family)
MTGRLEDKVALITGGGSGIGAAMVRRFVTEGATVYLADRAKTPADRIVEETGARFILLDVASEQAWTDALARIAGEAGRLEILCNNAGIVGSQPIADTDLATWERVLSINVTGAMLGCREAIRLMRQLAAGRSGSIINTASTAATLGLAFDAAYTASKHAVLGLTRSVATWCAQERLPIRCNALHPGTTLTAMVQGYIDARPELKPVIEGMSPIGRLAAPQEIANLAVFLASDESSYCTGGAFVADGGLTAKHPAI